MNKLNLIIRAYHSLKADQFDKQAGLLAEYLHAKFEESPDEFRREFGAALVEELCSPAE